VLGELEYLAEPLLAHPLSVLVLALGPQEASFRVLRQVCDVLTGLLEVLSCIQDGLRKNINIDIMSDHISLRKRPPIFLRDGSLRLTSVSTMEPGIGKE
jgi:hypothetical protein